MDGSMPATPCGLVAKSFFNDTFELYKLNDDGVQKLVVYETISPEVRKQV